MQPLTVLALLTCTLLPTSATLRASTPVPLVPHGAAPEVERFHMNLLDALELRLEGMLELAQMAGTGQNTSLQLQALNARYQRLKNEIDFLARTAEWNGYPWANGTHPRAQIEVLPGGPRVRLPLADLTAATLSLTGNILSAAAATSRVAVLRTAICTVDVARHLAGRAYSKVEDPLQGIPGERLQSPPPRDALRGRPRRG